MNLACLVDRWADLTPQGSALLTEAGPRDWRTTRERIARIAAGLAARGLRAGDRVALLARNSPGFFEALLATAWAGLVTVPLNWRLSPAEIAFQLRDTAAALVIADDALVPLLAASDAGIDRLSVEDGVERLARDHALIESPAPRAADDLFGIFYTGGTTGTPKGVMLTHGNLLANAGNVLPLVPYAPGDVHLHVAPMFHLADLGYAFVSLYAGGAHAFMTAFAPQATVDALARHRATHTLLAPAMIEAIVREAELPAPGSPHLAAWRLLAYGGAPIAEESLERALVALPCGLAQGYGQTEATHTLATLTVADHRALAARPERRSSCGRAPIGVQLRLLDDGGRPVPVGEVGEVCARAGTIMKGYWRREAETAAALAGGWLHTGDLGRMDADGYLTLLDRKKDMIVSGAENVYSVEVENALARHPAVREVAVIAVPDARWGERVHAVVALAAGASASIDALQAHCRTLIGGYKIPRSVEFVDALPRSAAGKVQKEVLRAAHWAGRARGIG